MREDKESKYFKVDGAGDVQVGKSASSVTGRVAGFHIGVSWSDARYCGGVMSRAEAKQLADHIYKTLEKCTDTEEECVSKCYIGLNLKP